MPLDNFKFGPVNAASQVPQLADILGDHGALTDPFLPPNPVFEFSPASLVHAELFGPPIFTDSSIAHHDDLLI